MSNKKTIKRNKRNSKRGKSRKGGFFGMFKDKHNSECDPNNLDNLETSSQLHTEYQKCCPKSWYGRKNNSPYCKDIDLKFKELFNATRKDANLSKQLMTQTFTTNDDGAVDMIDCEDPELYNDEESIAKYNAACNCDKTRWNPFSKKRKNCGIVKKKLEIIKRQQQDDEVSHQQEQQRRQQEEEEQQERQYQIRQAKQKRSQEMKAAEEEERKRKALTNQTYENIEKKKIEQRDKFMDNYMQKYPPNLYDNYTRQQLNRNPQEIITNHKNKEETVKQFMIKYNPKEYGYTYDQLMMDPKEVENQVKKKEPEIEHKRYQENLDPYDIEKGVPLENENKYVDILGEDDDDEGDNEGDNEGDMSHRSSYYGGSKTKKHLKKRSIRKRKQKRRKTRKQ